MTDLEKLKAWLLTYPGWQGPLFTDSTDPQPGNAGLFPAGLEELSRQEDVLGNVTVRCRYHFVLHRNTVMTQDNGENARWLMDFQNWVQRQSAMGLAPTFGDEPTQERIRAEKGKLKEASQTGTGTYAVNMTAEFIKKY